MKRRCAWLLVGVLLMLPGFACSKKGNLQTKRNPVAEKPLEDETSEIKAATPDDPGPIATAASPMAIWMRNAERRKAQREAQRALEPQEPQSSDHVALTALIPPQVLVHKTFPVRQYAKFEFVVPAHVHYPKLLGGFKSFVKARGSGSAGDQGADMDLLLLDEQAFNDFVHGANGSPTDAAGPSDSQQVEWGLTSTFDQPNKYYLVFVNPANGQQTRFVQADFTISFE